MPKLGHCWSIARKRCFRYRQFRRHYPDRHYRRHRRFQAARDRAAPTAGRRPASRIACREPCQRHHRVRGVGLRHGWGTRPSAGPDGQTDRCARATAVRAQLPRRPVVPDGRSHHGGRPGRGGPRHRFGDREPSDPVRRTAARGLPRRRDNGNLRSNDPNASSYNECGVCVLIREPGRPLS